MTGDDREYHFNKKPGKTYVSKSLTFENGRPIRIASKVIDSEEGHKFMKEKGELLIRRTDGGRQEIVAKFFEDDRSIDVLTIQRFNVTGSPHALSFSFLPHEIDELLDFLNNIKRLHFPHSGKVNVSDDQLRTILLSDDQARRLLTRDNEDLIIDLVRTEITKQDVVALNYRREQLRLFERLLEDDDFFNEEVYAHNGSPERVWQQFFDRNKWIFGYGLSFIFLSSLEGRDLEQVVRGFNFDGKGKRTDALMKTRGLISSLCFVEIKTHRTELLHPSEYRPATWRPHKELSGAVAQAQVTVQTALHHLEECTRPSEAAGDPTGEHLYNIEPRSFVVIGRLGEFHTSKGVNAAKFRSFELYRRNLVQPEIITFDELYERARLIVEHED